MPERESARIRELRKTLAQDPFSLVFVQLAEEYRRAGEYDKAISVCRAGLKNHPDYVGGRVALGRALTDSGDLDTALEEFRRVLIASPDNLAAHRSLAELWVRTGQLEDALERYRVVLSLTNGDPHIAATIADLEQRLSESAGAPVAQTARPGPARPETALPGETASPARPTLPAATPPRQHLDPGDELRSEAREQERSRTEDQPPTPTQPRDGSQRSARQAEGHRGGAPPPGSERAKHTITVLEEWLRRIQSLGGTGKDRGI